MGGMEGSRTVYNRCLTPPSQSLEGKEVHGTWTDWKSSQTEVRWGVSRHSGTETETLWEGDRQAEHPIPGPGRGQAGHLGLHFPGPQAERLGEITPNLRIPKEQEWMLVT